MQLLVDVFLSVGPILDGTGVVAGRVSGLRLSSEAQVPSIPDRGHDRAVVKITLQQAVPGFREEVGGGDGQSASILIGLAGLVNGGNEVQLLLDVFFTRANWETTA